EHADVGTGAALHVDANLSRGLFLRALNRADDAIVIELLQKIFVIHYQPSLAPPPPNPPPPPPNPPHPPPPPPDPPPPNDLPRPPPRKNIGQRRPPQPGRGARVP